MNTWDNKKAHKIVEILQLNKHGIGFRKLSRDSSISRGGLEVSLKRLRELSIVKDEPRIPILLTEEALESYEKGTLVIPRDPRSKKNKLTDRERKTLFLILSIATRGRIKLKRIYQTQLRSRSIVKSLQNKEFLYGDGNRIPGVAINDIVYKYKNKKKNKSSILRGRLLENRINPFNMDLFGYLELSIDEANRSMKFLTQYDPPILVEKKYHNQTRYVVKDEELKKFINICIILYCQDVYYILEYFYSLNESIIKAREKKEIEYFENSHSSYPNILKEELITKNRRLKKLLKGSPFYKYRLKRKPEQNSKEHPDQIKKYEEYMREIWFGEDRTTDYFKYMKSGLLEDSAHNIRGSLIDIHKCNIFDDEFEDINDKYKILQEKYPEIIGALLDTLFPEFFRDIIKEDYMKNYR